VYLLDCANSTSVKYARMVDKQNSCRNKSAFLLQIQEISSWLKGSSLNTLYCFVITSSKVATSVYIQSLVFCDDEDEKIIFSFKYVFKHLSHVKCVVISVLYKISNLVCIYPISVN